MHLTSEELQKDVKAGDFKSLARAISLVENELQGYEQLLFSLTYDSSVPVIGFTGPPGSGKSSLINRLAKDYAEKGKRIAIVAVDPTSPFNYGSLLGDRLRMTELFSLPGVYIRSLATRGSLGGLSDKIIEVTDVIRSAGFDMVIVETVGVGQSEVEIAGLADVTVVVFVPESGDEIQTMKSGIMEIADVFVINKSDREGADRLAASLKTMIKSKHEHIPVIKTSVLQSSGIVELADAIGHPSPTHLKEKKLFLLTEKVYRLIRRKRMHDVSRQHIMESLKDLAGSPDFNLYKYAHQF